MTTYEIYNDSPNWSICIKFGVSEIHITVGSYNDAENLIVKLIKEGI